MQTNKINAIVVNFRWCSRIKTELILYSKIWCLWKVSSLVKKVHIWGGNGATKREQRSGQTHQNILAQMIEFHTDLANLTDCASLRPRLSALPSVAAGWQTRV